MTTKELLYIEDALGHVKSFQTQCQNAAGQLVDPQLKSWVQDLEQKTNQLYQGFYGLL